MNSKNIHWWKSAVFYSLYVDRFAGDFRNLTRNLSYFELIGVDALWILPHYPSPMIDGGYDIVDFLNVRSDLGTLDDFKSFIEQAHHKKIRVIIDITLNHTSNQHEWFKQASEAIDSNYRDYYIWSKTGQELKQAQNPFSNIKPSNWIKNSTNDDYYFATFYPEQPDLNWKNPKVMEEMLKVFDFWMDIEVDGFRLDSIPRLIKKEGTTCVNQPEVHTIVKKIRNHIDKKDKNIILIAENDLPINEAKNYFGNGDECHVGLNFMYGLGLWLKQKDNKSKELAQYLEESSHVPDNCTWASFLDNHDSHALYLLSKEQGTDLGTWMDPLGKFSHKPGSKTAMRVAEILQGDSEKIIAIYKELFSLPGAHIIYYGDEIGMKNMAFDSQPNDSREYVRGIFNWTEAERQIRDNNSLLNKMIELIRTSKH